MMNIEQLMKRYTYDQLKEMYAKDRKIVQDRLYRMGKTEFRRSKTYTENYNKLPRVRDLKTKEELAAAFYDVNKLILSGYTSITKQRMQKAKALSGLRANNYDFINESNFWDFYDFMEWYKNTKLIQVYGSPTDEEVQTYLDNVEKKKDPSAMKEAFLEYKGSTSKEFEAFLER